MRLLFVYTSGIQHFAETLEGKSNMPDYVKDFLRKAPVSWDDTHSQLPCMNKDVTLPLDRMFKVNFPRNGGFVIIWRQK